jgi:hypothetical protein
VADDSDDAALAAARKRAAQLGLALTLGHMGTRGQLAFAVPVGDLDYWQASLHREGQRGAVAMEIRNTAVEAANAVLRSYERSESGQ